MVKAILGKKFGMTQVFGKNGDVTPVTVLKAGPCIVIQRKTTGKEGYEAAQLGLVELPPPKRVSRPREGHFRKAGANPVRFLREVRLGPDAGEVNIGDKVLADVFSVDDYVDVTGVSKGRGFAGVPQASPLWWWWGVARFHVPSCSGLDWGFGMALSGSQGDESGRPYGQCARHGAQSARGSGACGGEHFVGRGCCSGSSRQLRGSSQGQGAA